MFVYDLVVCLILALVDLRWYVICGLLWFGCLFCGLVTAVACCVDLVCCFDCMICL